MDQARRLEHLSHLCRTLHRRLRRGRWARTRSRLRRQLARLELVLDEAQIASISDHDHSHLLSDPVAPLEPLLDLALQGDADKADLKELRRRCKRARLHLRFLLDTRAP